MDWHRGVNRKANGHRAGHPWLRLCAGMMDISGTPPYG